MPFDNQVIADLNIKHRATIVVERVLHPYARIANHVEEEL